MIVIQWSCLMLSLLLLFWNSFMASSSEKHQHIIRILKVQGCYQCMINQSLIIPLKSVFPSQCFHTFHMVNSWFFSDPKAGFPDPKFKNRWESDRLFALFSPFFWKLFSRFSHPPAHATTIPLQPKELRGKKVRQWLRSNSSKIFN